MIDLHMHTTNSDGFNSVKELLILAEQKNLEIVSITDHDCINAYNELKTFNYKQIYSGKIINGCELTTSFDGNIIEILAYGYDEDILNEFITKNYSQEIKDKCDMEIYNKFIEILNKLNLIYDHKFLDKNYAHESFGRLIYEDLISHAENVKNFDEKVFDDFSTFIRHGIYNPKSKLFLNHASYKPKLEDVLNAIHKANGKAFLAHCFKYAFKDTIKSVTNIIRNYKLDGIEAYYTTFNSEQSNKLLELCKKFNLLISGGSDYHGGNRKNYDLGTGNSNLNISRDIINNWNIKFWNE